MTFDPENRMSGYSGSTQTNVYSGYGMRATKAGTRAGKYLYDGNVPVIEFTASNEVSNTFGPDGLVSRHVLGGVTTFYTFDERGNVSQRLTNTGSISSTDAYDSYGTRSSTVSAQPDPWGYEAEVGYYTDTETGLILCTHRFYDPATGRFVTRDPIGYDGGVNLYGYVGNDPGNEDDPEGYWGEDAVQSLPPGARTAGELALAAAALATALYEYLRDHPIHWPSSAPIAAKGDRPPNLSAPGAKQRGAFRGAKRGSGIPVSQQPSRQCPAKNKSGESIPGEDIEFDQPNPGSTPPKIVRHHPGGHDYPGDPSQNRGPHYNDTNGGHYDYPSTDVQGNL